MGAALADEALDAVFASDLQRARDTAQAIAQAQGLQVQIVPALRERCYGGFEGLRHQEIAERYPADFAAWKAREPDARYPAGERIAETMREFSARAVAAVTALVQQNNYRKIAVVTHGGVLECLYRWSQQSGFGKARDFDIFNASINRLHWDGSQIQIRQWGDISHLRTDALDEVDR